MTDLLSRDSSPSNNNDNVKAEDLWNNWFTVKTSNVSKPKLVEPKNHRNRPITNELTKSNETSGSGEASGESKLTKRANSKKHDCVK